MNIVTKAAGVVLAAAALCGIGASAAFAATPTGGRLARRGRVEQHLVPLVEPGGCAAGLAGVPHLQPDHDADDPEGDRRRRELRR